MSAKESVDLLKEAKKEGLPVTGETAPHYLTLTNRDFLRVGTNMKGYPPVRYQADQDRLWEGLRDGTIDSMGSDHAPHTAQEKNGEPVQDPFGYVLYQTMVPLMLNAVNQGRSREPAGEGDVGEYRKALRPLPEEGLCSCGNRCGFYDRGYE